MNMPRFGLPAALLAMCAKAVFGHTTGDRLLSAVQAVAALLLATPWGASAQDAADSIVPPSDIRDVFATGYMLEDRNGDQVVDFVNVRILLPSAPWEAHVTAAANLAARLGYETSAMNLGLTETGGGARAASMFRSS